MGGRFSYVYVWESKELKVSSYQRPERESLAQRFYTP